MSRVRIGINGFGRIGRVFFRAALEDAGVEIVGINLLGNPQQAAHLLKYDSTHGTLAADVKAEGEGEGAKLFVDGKAIPLSAVRDPAQIPWKAWGADIVVDCTGAFNDKREELLKHIAGGAKKVIASAPAKAADETIVFGINHSAYDPAKHQILSNASCTTNCLAPVAKVLNDAFGIERGLMTTIHAFTNDQMVLDNPHKDLRRARTASASMIPTTTGAAKAVSQVLPELKGKLDGTSVRVPTQNVSLVDLTFTAAKDVTVEAINEALIAAAAGPLKGVLYCESAPLVSVDFNGNRHSSIVDLPSTMVTGSGSQKLAKVFSWYDNETGFSSRMVDLAKYMATKGL
ncbi:MAG: type I glyceraldehyde-3-phosphate dehydrogenase [Bdellovibrionales bacterium]|jgi:glyceraldehyde 3-phosphate dehydrogenase|nr:type I glyceraldehyde-3-phosphate dehydrogenase [Bdellovibrionales bacterium]